MWKTRISISDEIISKIENQSESIFSDGEFNDNFLERIDCGGGRDVFTVKDDAFPDGYLVKIAHNSYGVNEIANEVHLRNNASKEFKNILVPNVKSGYGWCIQPKCKTMTDLITRDKCEEIRERARKQGYTEVSEIYLQNLGVFNNKVVIIDYGGLRK